MCAGFRNLVAAVALLALGASSCARRDAPPSRTGISGSNEHAASTSNAARIVGFFGTPDIIDRGGSSMLCYGVLNARSVRLRPSASGLLPARHYCFAVSPSHTTKYVLTVVGVDGREVSESFVLRVTTTDAEPQILVDVRLVPSTATPIALSAGQAPAL